MTEALLRKALREPVCEDFLFVRQELGASAPRNVWLAATLVTCSDPVRKSHSEVWLWPVGISAGSPAPHHLLDALANATGRSEMESTLDRAVDSTTRTFCGDYCWASSSEGDGPESGFVMYCFSVPFVDPDTDPYSSCSSTTILSSPSTATRSISNG